MTAPRVEVDLGKIRHNTRCLVRRLKSREINVTGVTKAVCGHPAIANAMLDGGATGLADARITNVERLRQAGIKCPVSLIRTPMLSQVDQIVQSCETSYNTEIEVIKQLAVAARRTKTVHHIILLVEMGDMREGIMPRDLEAVAQQVLKMPGVALKGIGANFACLSGKAPADATMAAFSALANDIESACGPFIETVSGGNSANLPWALGPRPTDRINNLRLGEAILLGVDPVSGDQIGGLYTDAFTFVGEVIETKFKPEPIPPFLVDSARAVLRLVPDQFDRARSILAIGQQDTDTKGLLTPEGVTFVGATSDHLIVRTTNSRLRVGSEVRLQLNYSALMRAMIAPDVAKVMLDDIPLAKANAVRLSGPRLELV